MSNIFDNCGNLLNCVAGLSLAVGLLALILGGVLLAVALVDFRFIRRRNWATTEGRVIAANTREYDSGEGMAYELVIHYSYTVEGVEKRSKYEHSWDSKSARDDVAALYRSAHRLFVQYDPENTSLSWIREHEHKAPRAILIHGIIWLVVAILLIAFGAFGA